MGRVNPRQLSFVFADSPEGGGGKKTDGVPEVKAWLLRIAKSKESHKLTAREAGNTQLLEQVASPGNLAKALRKVARNKGAPGLDGRSVDEVVKNARSLLPKLRHALLTGSYRPGDIRRVWIPKPNGGQRGLGIPNVVDRWVQQAVLQILEPIFEPLFHNSSHGFRPERGAHTAIAEAKRYVAEGYKVVVDIDISKFFDHVNHQRLLNRLAQCVKDGRVLKLIHRMLRAKVVMPDGTKVIVEEGTPQGGPLSPMLSNVVLDELDQELDRRGLHFVRYADDCNIYVRSRRAGLRVMDSVRQVLNKRLRLRINEEKSSVSRFDRVHFLGFRLGMNRKGRIEVHLSKRSIKRIKTRIREMTPRTWGSTLKACMDQLNKYLKGWEAYFDICTERGVQIFKKFDAHIRRRLRMIIIKQKKRPRYLFRHLLSRGVPRVYAAKSAFARRGWWFRSNTTGINMAYPIAWFDGRLISLFQLWEKRHAKPVRASDGQLLLPFAG